MARITRATQQLFGVNGNVGTGGYGAAAAGNVNTQLASSTALATIQGLSEWTNGWSSATLGASKFPAIEDMNAVDYAFSTQLAYILQQGAAIEYDAGTTYYKGSVVASPGTTQLYKSLIDTNLGNALSNTTDWQSLGDLASLGAAFAQCVFQYTSATICTLLPKNGNQLSSPVNGNFIIPAAGITLSYNAASINGTPGNILSPNTLYYCYAWYNGSAWIIDVSQTGYATDATTGITIKSGDNTRVLVGMVYTNGSGQFVSSTTSKQVRSYHNDRGIVLSNSFSTTRSTSSGTLAEINTEIRCNALLWLNEIVDATIAATGSNNTGGQGGTTSFGIDSTSVSSGNLCTSSSPSANQLFGIFCAYAGNSLSETLHYFTLLGAVANANTFTWVQATYINISTQR